MEGKCLILSLAHWFGVTFIFEGNLKLKAVCLGFVKRFFSLLLEYHGEHKMKLMLHLKWKVIAKGAALEKKTWASQWRS